MKPKALPFPEGDHVNTDASGNEVPCAIENNEIFSLWETESGEQIWIGIRAIDVEQIQVYTEKPF